MDGAEPPRWQMYNNTKTILQSLILLIVSYMAASKEVSNDL